ncbi:ANTAR domain-containing protein [Cellulomonas sp. URHD0024]|uniref:ANTAR domain-containing protein n=1 Tax=Cellulomonas sp. URHD0024 TaxID=1302620 RepID=UPI0012DC2C54|nr:ANTAR domain-containing protein [Cellulomonas sp. URHD0024]
MTTSVRVGRFSFSPEATRWAWSDEMFALHGMAPGDVVPTRALFLSHVHPGDRDQVADVLLGAEDGTRACSYRLLDLSGAQHDVVVAAARSESGAVQGFVVDDTQQRSRAVAAAVNEQLKVALESHAVIDQAKGMLMMTYGIDDGSAFNLLRSASQQHNVRLRALAERLVDSARSLSGQDVVPRAVMDELFVRAIDDRRPAAPHGPSATVELDELPAGPRLRVHGEVDLTSMTELDAALSRLLETARPRGRVVVDLSDVPQVGAAALDVLRAAQRRCAARAITMEVVGAGAEHPPEPHAASASRSAGHPDRGLVPRLR